MKYARGPGDVLNAAAFLELWHEAMKIPCPVCHNDRNWYPGAICGPSSGFPGIHAERLAAVNVGKEGDG